MEMEMENDNAGPVVKGDLPDDLDPGEPSDYLAASAALFAEWLSPEDETAFADL